jgi:hypothetical protein
MFQYVYNNGTLDIKFNKTIEENKETYENTSTIYLDESDDSTQIVYILEIKFSDLVCFNTYHTCYTHVDISNINPIFGNNIECFFDLFEEKPFELEIGEDILNIIYVLQIGKRKHNITIPVNLKIIEGDTGKYEKLKSQNVYLSNKLFDLEKEYKKIMVCKILLIIDEISFMRNFELFKTLVSTNFDVNGDFRLYSGNRIENILDYIFQTHIGIILKNYENENGIFNTYVKFLVEETDFDINYQVKSQSILFKVSFFQTFQTGYVHTDDLLIFLIKNGVDSTHINATVEHLVKLVDAKVIQCNEDIKNTKRMFDVKYYRNELQEFAKLKKVIMNYLK